MERILNIFRIKDLRNKVLIVAGLLVCSRVLAAIPLPGIQQAALKNLLAGNQLLGFLNIFSGGALSTMSIAMLGLGPYITSTIIMQLLTMVFPSLKAMYYEEGAVGRSKFNRYTRYLTVPLAVLQSYGFLRLLASQGVITNLSLAQEIINVIVATAGSLVLVWFGELITEQKIGNGISLLIFAGIVAGLPTSFRNAILTYTPGSMPFYILFLLLILAVTAAMVLMNEGVRKVAVSYAKRIRGNRVYGGVSTYLPLKVNQAGMIPIIFAISVLLVPQFIGQVLAGFSTHFATTINSWVNSFMNNQLLYGVVYFVLVFAFTYFYTAITFDPNEISKNLQRSGGFIPGLRPGEPTAQYLSKVTSRITFFGALFLGLVAILPLIIQAFTHTQSLTISGAAMLIVVAVALEVAQQIDSQLTVREYEGIR
ncbi:MAG: preprotein translocase subunit SecY [Patescibacteria group bacterium]|nr:preprotein translocase subunit SecY [Patescibacteria group bacterium]MCL5224013.1 preprotein translocase subunit SecY [Patescibacteria group bacterium]